MISTRVDVAGKMRLVRGCVVILSVLVGCYSPSLREGAPCQTADECPTAQHCVAHRCSLSETPPPDAAPVLPPDAPPPDGPPPDAMRPVCSTTGLACAVAGAITMFDCGGHCWVRCPSLVTHAAAVTACINWNGQLGEIDDATEDDCVAAHNNATRMWFGLVQDNAAATADMGWTWNGTGALNYKHWRVARPDDGNGGVEVHNEQCGSFETDGTYDDQPCVNLGGVPFTLGFLCERP
jgi:hypothetical protein